MPMNRKLYPANWTQISQRIRERANNHCEVCGIENHTLILRSDIDGSRYLTLRNDGCYYAQAGEVVRLSEMPEEFERDKFTRVVLTVAHWDNPDPMDCRDENLKALCQRCHLMHDKKWLFGISG